MIFGVNVFKWYVNAIFVNQYKCLERCLHQLRLTNESQERIWQLSESFAHLARSDADKDKITNVIAEYEVAKHTRRCVPSNLVADHVEELMSLPTKSQRMKYLMYLRRKEGLKLKSARKRQEQQELQQRRPRVESNHIKYGLCNNTLFVNVGRSRMKALQELHAGCRMMLCQKLVVDLSYDDFMTKWEAKNCAKQLCLVNSVNRQHAMPFSLYFCNADNSKYTVQYLEKSLPNIWKDNSVITCSTASYLDIFLKESLVYLSPHSDEVMESYDPNVVYVIGGFVDKSNRVHASLEKARKDGIRSYRLPLDEYVEWKAGSKSLTLDQVVSILLEMKVSNDWKRAFCFLPQRKISEISLEEDI